MEQRSHKIGLDGNQPLDHEGNVARRLATPEIIADTGVAWVRINFVLGPYGDPTHQDWILKYNKIVDQYLNEGLQVYALIGHESVRSSTGLPDHFRDHRDQTSDRNKADKWIAEYVQNFATIVKQFKGRITHFESFNEPDDWHGANRNWIHPTWFAVMLDQVYRKIKDEIGIRDIKLISGPLQGLSINNNAPVKYMGDTYQYGREKLGWGTTRPFPFEGVGYHIYIHEDENNDWANQEGKVRSTYRKFVDAFRAVIRRYEGRDKQLYISEIGWHSNRNNAAAEKFQADNMKLALDLMTNDASIAVGIWFCTEDFAPGSKFYGIYRMGDPTPNGRKPAYNTLKAYCDKLIADSKRVVPPPPPPPELSIPQQIAALVNQIAALYTGAGAAAPAAPSGSISNQLGQLRNYLTSLGVAAVTPAATLKQQIAQIGEVVKQLQANPPTKIDRGGTSPPPPPPGQTIMQQIATLAEQIISLFSRAGRPTPAAPSGSILDRLGQLRSNLATLGVPPVAPAPTIRGQIAQIQQLIGQAGASSGDPVGPPEGPAGQTITQEIAELVSHIGALYGRAGQAAPAAPSGSIQGQLAQLRNNIMAIGAAAVSPARSIRDQISQLKEMIREVAIKPIDENKPPDPGGTDPGSGPGGSGAAEVRQEIATMKHQLALLQQQIAALQQQMDRVLAGGPVTPPRPRVAKPPIQDIINVLSRNANPQVPFGTRSEAQIRRIIIHHTGAKAEWGANIVANYRVNKLGWAGIGYHYFITQEGIIQATEHHTTIGRHTGKYDADSLGIGFAGNFNAAPPPAAQFEAGVRLIAWLMQELGISPQNVLGHKDIPVNTASPGIQWDSGAKWGEQLRKRLQTL